MKNFQLQLNYCLKQIIPLKKYLLLVGLKILTIFHDYLRNVTVYLQQNTKMNLVDTYNKKNYGNVFRNFFIDYSSSNAPV